ncbi:hypothetical protein PP340_gp18 [Arthrobacter phage Adaia]|uniref:Uncharacterized protein n=1 Tax=Arthrobacter phage Adaia TaxID=2419945 RepID=A0A3G2KD41_9CAUD|nr:hypothetical protein PP340_gp18 [Arthrobacter phage Adaia]AYN56815.1 hypothetical protein PBI_ADAIA_18 [Arthrobacter phage Adaia]
MNSAIAALHEGRRLACKAPCSSVVERKGLLLCTRTEKDVPATLIFGRLHKLFDRSAYKRLK